MKTPNLFKYATSELSQDAVLAYILSWAKPEYSQDYPKLNQLGERLLRALVAAAADGKGAPNPLNDSSITELDIQTQYKHIDICLRINGDIFLIIEDKTNTCEAPGQIDRYEKAAEERQARRGETWQILPVYVKTGNECQPSVPPKYVRFMREDLLKVLDDTPCTENTIIDDFRGYISDWQNQTDSYTTTQWRKWCWCAHEGYYMNLEQWMRKELKPQDFPSWRYVSNPAGGFLGFWWYWRPFKPHNCQLYLQIEPDMKGDPQHKRTRLHIRAGSAKADDNTDIKTHKNLLYAVLKAIEDAASQERFASLRIEKAGRYGGGWSANVADLFFDDQTDSYLAVSEDGILDWPATQNRLLLAMELLDAVSSLSPKGSK